MDDLITIMASLEDWAHSWTETMATFWAAYPLLPMYLHLIVSAILPIYAGAHASLSRPSSAAKAPKDAHQVDEEDEEEKVQKMEGLGYSDAIILPVTAGLVLGGLYWLITKYGAAVINTILGWYFAGVGFFSVTKLVSDILNLCAQIEFPNYFVARGSLWKINAKRRICVDVDDDNKTRSSPRPRLLGYLSLPRWYTDSEWWFREALKRKFTVKAYVAGLVDFNANLTRSDVVGGIVGVVTVLYVTLVERPWFLTNLQGFAVSYCALQLLSPTTFGIGSLILSALFCYDIWAVFFTPLMTTVAKELDQPIKLMFPRPDEPAEEAGMPPIRNYSMLGLGDIVVPGIMIGLALRFDLYLFYLSKQKKTASAAREGRQASEDIEKAAYVSPKGRWGDWLWTCTLPQSALPAPLRSAFPKWYFGASLIGYTVGMAATIGVMSVYQHAQPALLYLVPGVLVSLWGTALVRGQVGEMRRFTEAVNGEQVGAEPDLAEDTKEGDDEQDGAGIFQRLWQALTGGRENEGEREQKKGSERPAAPDSTPEDADPVLVSFSISVYNTKATARRKSQTGERPSGSLRRSKRLTSASRSDSPGLSDDTVVVSRTDLDGQEDEPRPRRRTHGRAA